VANPKPGRLGLIDGASLLNFSTLGEVQETVDDQADRLARMAEGVAARYAEYNPSLEGYNEEMPDALHMIGEALAVKFSETARRIDLLGLQSESQGPHRYVRAAFKFNEIIPTLALSILDFFALSSPKHSVSFTKVFSTPLLTDADDNDARQTRLTEEMDNPFIEFDENLKV